MADPAIEPAETTDDTSTDATTDDTSVDTTTTDDTSTDTTTTDDTTTDDKSVDDKGKTGDEGDHIAPESYSDFTLPEGVELDEALLAKAAPLFKELNLSQDMAQKVVDFQAEMVKEGEERQGDAFNQLMDDWRKESANDKDFGGDKFEENLGVAKLAVEKFGTPELDQLMKDHGVGNHPEMIRFMWNIGKLLKEDVPGGFSAASSAKKDRVSIMYPDES